MRVVLAWKRASSSHWQWARHVASGKCRTHAGLTRGRCPAYRSTSFPSSQTAVAVITLTLRNVETHYMQLSLGTLFQLRQVQRQVLH